LLLNKRMNLSIVLAALSSIKKVISPLGDSLQQC
jgi:hypothetical protein